MAGKTHLARQWPQAPEIQARNPRGSQMDGVSIEPDSLGARLTTGTQAGSEGVEVSLLVYLKKFWMQSLFTTSPRTLSQYRLYRLYRLFRQSGKSLWNMDHWNNVSISSTKPTINCSVVRMTISWRHACQQDHEFLTATYHLEHTWAQAVGHPEYLLYHLQKNVTTSHSIIEFNRCPTPTAAHDGGEIQG